MQENEEEVTRAVFIVKHGKNQSEVSSPIVILSIKKTRSVARKSMKMKPATKSLKFDVMYIL